MNEESLDIDPIQDTIKYDKKILLGALYATTLIYLYQQVFSTNYLFVNRFFSGGYITFFMKHLIPIVIVVLVALLFIKQMKTKQPKRMVKIYITWLCSLFIYFIIFYFELRKFLMILLRKSINLNMNRIREPEFLKTYIDPLFFPLTMAIIIYLLVVVSSSQSTNQF